LLFYSRYQSNDPEDFATELTRMQSSILRSSGRSIYRKPYLYELPATMSYSQLSMALYRTISSHAMLQVQFKYERKLQRYEQYIVQLPSLNDWDIPIVDIGMQPEMYIITEETSVSLLGGYPWRIKFLQYDDKRYMYLEFHSICVDHYGVKCFEDTLFRALRSGYQLPSGNLSSYRLVRNMEIISSNFRQKRQDPVQFPLIQEPGMRIITASYELTSDQMMVIEQIKKRYNVEASVVYQLIVEQMLGYDSEGELYGMIDNWRSTLRNFDEVGCFYYMNGEVVQGLGVMRSRLMTLQLQHQKRKEGEFTTISKRNDYSIVYSYEEVLCQRLVEVPADQYGPYELFIRIRCGQAGTTVKFEYSPEHYCREQIKQYYIHLYNVMNTLRQQLLTNCAS